ncbi:MAG: hypothetical protein HYX21_03940 [Candidatus Yanofskybacteria bacterium]|nr:hypothetical protein [Candidatus Yanofskybacteria bacterium]
MPRFKMFYQSEKEKDLVESYGFEAIPYRDPTPEEIRIICDLESFLEEARELNILENQVEVEDALLISLILNTNPENK